MSLLYTCVCLFALGVVLSFGGSANGAEQRLDPNATLNVTEEMHLITKSLDDLLGELAVIKQEANGRLSKNRGPAGVSDPEHIRQVKVSRFVLRRVAELESESLSMRDELSRLFKLRFKQNHPRLSSGQAKQEDLDFDDQPSQQQSPTTTTQSKPNGMPETSTTSKPTEQEEAAKIGFDVEALKKLGEEIGKRLDQFGKDAAKNLSDLLEGVKLVFREPGDELEIELEARQQQPVESLRGVHEQIIRLMDNMVQNYLGNVRRTIQRMSNFIDNRRANLANSGGRPREASADAAAIVATQNKPSGTDKSPATSEVTGQLVESFVTVRQSILNRIQILSKGMHDFNMQWTRAVGKQQSPLIDRIPPRGIELWIDFRNAVRSQVRRINEEFRQLSRDMVRLVTGRLPTGSDNPANLLYSAPVNGQIEQQVKRFQEFYDKMSVTLGEEQLKMDDNLKKASQAEINDKLDQSSNLIDEQDDQSTRDELTRNPALRLQIQQEINVFGSIFDIMRAFIQRLRESATNVVRDVIQPGASNNNNNDPVTPGPSIKPQVDKLLDETIDSQRNINSQSKPVLLPNVRPTIGSRDH